MALDTHYNTHASCRNTQYEFKSPQHGIEGGHMDLTNQWKSWPPIDCRSKFLSQIYAWKTDFYVYTQQSILSKRGLLLLLYIRVARLSLLFLFYPIMKINAFTISGYWRIGMPSPNFIFKIATYSHCYCLFCLQWIVSLEDQVARHSLIKLLQTLWN